jgi:exosortase/archaeosortase family protein
VQPELRSVLRLRLREVDFWLGIIALGATLVALYPVIGWLIEGTLAQEQLLHALLVLVLFGFAMFYRWERMPPLSLNLSTASIRCLITCFGLFLFAWISSWSFLLLPALCAFVAAILFFLSDQWRPRSASALIGAFAVFVTLSWLMAPLDWPLRMVAGMTSQFFFDWLGNGAQLGVLNAPEGSRLILAVSGKLFEVAPECNGFGVITSGLLLTTLVGIYNGLRTLGLILWLLLALALGLFMNWLRIAIIVTLAPHMMPHYDVMHEIVGGITYWGTLLLLWFLLDLRVKELPPQKHQQ